MFKSSIKITQQFTLPAVISSARQKGAPKSGIGAFIILNEEGWILTADHIVKELVTLDQEMRDLKAAEATALQIKNDPNLSAGQRKKKIRNALKGHPNPLLAFSAWWGRDGWMVSSFKRDPEADIAVGQIANFDPASVSAYPIIKDPTKGFDIGQSLCKLGFPFHQIDPTFESSLGAFELPPEAVPVPLFPIEGIFTRNRIEQVGERGIKLLETSSPGLRGQSGGPIFDPQGRVWAMQIKTVHHPLGFSPKPPHRSNPEHQFLNAGVGVHAETIIDFLTRSNVAFQKSAD